MSRWWNELVADIGDRVPGGVPVLAVGLVLFTALLSALWYWWPAWLPTRWPRRFRSGRSRSGTRRIGRPGRLRRLRLRWRLRWRRRCRPAPTAASLPDDQVPDLPATTLASTADELAAAGRYAEAVRERLRAIVRDLIERQVIAAVAGWTVSELARAAGNARPATAPPLRAASETFSEIWYGQRPATADDDQRMRAYAEAVSAAVTAEPATATGPPATAVAP